MYINKAPGNGEINLWKRFRFHEACLVRIQFGWVSEYQIPNGYTKKFSVYEALSWVDFISLSFF